MGAPSEGYHSAHVCTVPRMAHGNPRNAQALCDSVGSQTVEQHQLGNPGSKTPVNVSMTQGICMEISFEEFAASALQAEWPTRDGRWHGVEDTRSPVDEPICQTVFQTEHHADFTSWCLHTDYNKHLTLNLGHLTFGI